MVCVDGRSLEFVRSRRKTSDNDRPAAGIGPDPRRTINGHMEMSDAGRHIERLRAEHRDDLQIFGAVLDETTPRLNGSPKGASTTIFAAGCG